MATPAFRVEADGLRFEWTGAAHDPVTVRRPGARGLTVIQPPTARTVTAFMSIVDEYRAIKVK